MRQMKEILPDGEFEAFCKTYGEPAVRGVRWNRLKVAPGMDGCHSGMMEFYSGTAGSCRGDRPRSPAGLHCAMPGRPQAAPTTPIPWCADGYIYPDTLRPAKSIFYHAGLFYIQEPSAMCPVEVLRPEPGHFVLDLCAAPGGKSAQIAGHLPGLLVSNDASPSRSRALVNNLERMGVTNAVVTTELPKKLADRFPGFFDRILVDAPCSGEGMFRRDPDAVKAYTANKPEACVEMQTEILRYAARMLKPGGRLVYSTCTFNIMENEGVITAFLDTNKNFAVMPIDHAGLGISQGLGELPQTGRIFPHLVNGEGHFIALLEKAGDDTNNVGAASGRPEYMGGQYRNQLVSDRHQLTFDFRRTKQPAQLHRRGRWQSSRPNVDYTDNQADYHPPLQHNTSPTPKEFAEFCNGYIIDADFTEGHIVTHGANLYLQPEPLDLRGLRVARSGWPLGKCAKGRFVPSHALAMGLRKENFRHAVNLSEKNALRYLRGESLDASGMFESKLEAAKPWIMVCYENFPLGWARLVQGRLKNNLPVGLVVQ